MSTGRKYLGCIVDKRFDYEYGNLNPALITLEDTVWEIAEYEEYAAGDAFSTIAQAIKEAITPQVLWLDRGWTIKAVVLSVYELTGEDAAHNNLDPRPIPASAETDPKDESSWREGGMEGLTTIACRARVPEFHCMIPVPVQPYGSGDYQTSCADMAVGCIDLHPEFIAELGVSNIASIIPGTIIGVSFPNQDLNTGKIVEVFATPTIATDEPEKPAPSPKDATEGDNAGMAKHFDSDSYVHCMPSSAQVAEQAAYKEEYLEYQGQRAQLGYTPYDNWSEDDLKWLLQDEYEEASAEEKKKAVEKWNTEKSLGQKKEEQYGTWDPKSVTGVKIGDSSMNPGEVDGVVYSTKGPAQCVPKELATQTKEQLNAADRVAPITVASNCTGTGTARFGGETPLQPATGQITHGFDEKRGETESGDPILHSGWDLNVQTGTNAYAIADGKILSSKSPTSYGRGGAYLEVEYTADDDSRVIIRYLHLSVLPEGAERGTIVKAGEVIALTGNTGNSSGDHLHFETYYIPPDDDTEFNWSDNRRKYRMDDALNTEILGWDNEEHDDPDLHGHGEHAWTETTGLMTGNARCPDNATDSDQLAAGDSDTSTGG
jgi:murein DD-endopeptidase MepM/ murein hydrolase activator NlpD